MKPGFRPARAASLALVLAALAAPVLPGQPAGAPPAEDPWTRLPEILSRIVAPEFPAKDFVVTKFGAKGDGRTDASAALRKAIEACAKAGGGRVVVPEGVFLTGPIRLKSRVNLHLAKGAVVRFATDPARYLPPVLTRWEGVELMGYSPLVYALDEESIAVTGEGTLDGGADADHWWPWKARGSQGQLGDRDRLLKMGEEGLPVAERVFGEGNRLRPPFVEPYRCRDVLIEGVTITNAPFWVIHPVLSRNVTVRNVKVVSHGPNNDGCDPESCKDVLIDNCYFDTGDDCIAIKSGRNNDGRRLATPTENIIIRNCTMKDGHGGITVGSEISGGVKNLFAHNNNLDSPDLWTAIRVKNNASRGGVLENFYYRNNTVGQVSRAVIEIDFNYEEGAKGDFTPVMRNLQIDGLTCRSGNRALDLQGFENAPIYDVSLSNCSFGEIKNASVIKNVRGLELKNVTVSGKKVVSL